MTNVSKRNPCLRNKFLKFGEKWTFIYKFAKNLKNAILIPKNTFLKRGQNSICWAKILIL